MSDVPGAGMSRRTLLYGGLAATGAAVLSGVGDKLFANRSFADFLKGAPKGSSVRDRLNLGLAECAAAGQLVVGSAGEYALDGPIHIPAGLRVECERDCVIQKAYDDLGARNALLLTAGDQAKDADDFSWSGGTFRPIDTSMGAGNLATLFGRRWVFKDAVMQAWRSGQCFIFGGGGFRMTNVDAKSASRQQGTGVFRCVWNDPSMPSLCANLYGMGGDDVFQAVPVSAATHPRFGLDVGNLTYENCEGASHIARLIAVGVVSGKVGNVTELPSRITNCTFRNVGGRGGNRSVIIQNDLGNLSKGSAIDNIVLDGCDIDCSKDYVGNLESVCIWSDRDGIGSVRITNTKIYGSVAPNVITVNGADKFVIDQGSSVSGRNTLMRCGHRYPVGQVTIRNSRFTPHTGGKPPVIMRVKDTAVLEGVTIANAPSVRAAVRMIGDGKLVVK